MIALDHIQLAMPQGGEDQARAFWSGLLGLAEIDKPEPLKPRGGVWFQLTGAALHLGVESPFAAAQKAHPGLHVSDIASLAIRLEAAGYPIAWDSSLPNRKRFFTVDPFGNRLEFLD